MCEVSAVGSELSSKELAEYLFRESDDVPHHTTRGTVIFECLLKAPNLVTV